MNHMEWDINYADVQRRLELRKEHNATVRAYRDAMAECERLGKANDEACDRIAELEFSPALTWEECGAKYMDLIDRAETDATSDYFDFRVWLQSRLAAPTDSIRVEAPLLAEIAEMKIHCDGRDAQVKHLECVAGKLHTDVSGLEDMVQRGNERWARVVAERDALKARVAELEEGLVARTNTRLMDELAALRAELEAAKSERESANKWKAECDAENTHLRAELADLRRLGMESNDLIVRLGNELAELRKAYEQQYEAMNVLVQELKRRDATLDALREAVPEGAKWCRDCKKFTKLATDLDGEYCSECEWDGYYDDEFQAFVYNTLYPQPKETGDADE